MPLDIGDVGGVHSANRGRPCICVLHPSALFREKALTNNDTQICKCSNKQSKQLFKFFSAYFAYQICDVQNHDLMTYVYSCIMQEVHCFGNNFGDDNCTVSSLVM
jgi:hypothetical protein